jgi:Matrixin
LKKFLIAVLATALLLQTMLVAFAYAMGPPTLQKQVFVHYAKGNKGKPQPPPVEVGYYSLLGPKWKTLPISFSVDPTDSGLSSAAVSAVLAGANEWDDGTFSATDDWSGVTVNLFINNPQTVSKPYDDNWDEMDGANTIIWGDLPNSNVIAVTNIWYSRRTGIVEFDMVFNTDYQWETNGNSAVMDVQNIATHELGHAAGLGDLYNPVASEETMFGYSDYGEITKRDLYVGDQAGITKLYR